MSTSLPQSGGTTASFGNAPQAGGDSFSYIEDYLMANGLLYNQATDTLTLDVMANDLGGKAKSLFSIDDGFGNQLSDLATSDLLTNQSFSTWQLTANGNSIRIVNGKIEYRLSDGHGGVRDVNSMNAGEVLTDTFTYAIKLGNGTLSWARVTVSLTGNNDTATISGDSTGAVVEAGGDDNSLPGTPTASGTLTVSDVDAGQATFATPLAASLAGAYGNFTFNPLTGQWTYALNNALAATQSLAQNESAVETLTVISLDGTASRTITVNITGTNDAPEITSAAQSGTVQEDTALSASGQVSASDVDNGAVLSYTGDAAGTYGSFAIDAASGEWSYTLDNAAHQALAQGEEHTETFTVTVEDEHGAQVTQDVVVAVKGTNDAPEITSAAQSGTVQEDTALSASGQVSASDVDNGAVLSYTGDAAGTYGSFAIDAASGEWSYTLDNAAHQALAQGEEHTETFTVTVEDEHGAQVTQDVVVAVKGTNDAPEITSAAQSGTVQEDTALTASGQVSASDVDNGAVLSYTGDAAGTYGSFAIDAASGEWSYTLDNAAHQALAQGEEHTETFTVTVEDEHGAQVTQDVVVAVKGTNDAPEITSAAQSGTVQEDTALSASGQVSASDVDNGAVLSYTGDAAGTYGSFAIDAASGEWSYTLDNAAHQALAQGEEHTETFTVTVSDEWGFTSFQDVEVTVKGLNDAPTGSASAALADGTEDTEYTVSAADLLLGFGDIDGDSLSVTGLSADHGSVVDNGDGTYTITPSGNYHGALTLTYSVTDGHGGSVAGSQSVTLVPVQDLIAEDDSYSGDEDQPITGDVSDNDSTTSGGSLSFTLATGVANGMLTFNADGTFEYQPGANYNGSDSFTYMVTDAASGESATRTVQLTIAAVNDAAVITGVVSGTIVEDALPPTIDGDANSTDVDGVNDAWNAASGTSAYGSWSVNAVGQWTYTLNNANPTVNALNNGQSLGDSFAIQTADGTSANVAITINGTTDITALILPATYAGNEDPNNFDNLGNPAGQNISSTATNLADTLYGGAGNDTINGQGGNDTLYAGSGADSSNGNNDNDTLYGGSGNDTLVGAGGNDLLVGGYGADNLTGSGGNDIFKFLGVRDTNDTVTDFNHAEDSFDFTGFDANTALAGIQQLVYGSAPTANGLWTQSVGGNTVLYVDTDGNLGTVEFMVTLTGNHTVDSTDLLGVANPSGLP